MKPRNLVIWLLLSLLPAVLSAQPMAPATDPAHVSTQLLQEMEAGRFDAAASHFSPEMLAAVPVDTLRTTWESLPAQVGELQSMGDPRLTRQGDMTLVVTPLQFQHLRLVSQVIVASDGRVYGFTIQPAPPEPAPQAASDASFVERDIHIGTADTALPATLTMPKGDGPFPAVILVHGSGPHDRNETIGPNRPFMDIARGLAERGIASLRYDKRTMARPQDFANRDFDMDDETTDDAVLAIDTLAEQSGIDPRRIHVIGHSQGGMLAPRIALHAKNHPVAGLILMAAPARPLLDLIPEQYRYAASLDGSIDAEEQAAIDQVQQQIANARSDGEFSSEQLPLGLSAYYWRQFEPVDPVADAKAADLPMLILQGDRDFQVVAADIARWQDAFTDNPHVRVIHYPKLSHLFITGDGPGAPEEYRKPGKVEAKVVDDIAQWINSQTPDGM